MTALTARSRQKSDRRGQLLAAAAALMAEHGFAAVRLEDIGAAAGVSGPAIYRHFPGKEALLVELLVGVSSRLLSGAQAVVARSVGPDEALDALVDFHLDFALGEPELIRIQDRDLSSLPVPAQRQVRGAQRRYVEIWVGVLCERDPLLAEVDARVSAHAAFGLLNSTPHSARGAGSHGARGAGSHSARGAGRTRAVLRAMTLAALAPGRGRTA